MPAKQCVKIANPKPGARTHMALEHAKGLVREGRAMFDSVGRVVLGRVSTEASGNVKAASGFEPSGRYLPLAEVIRLRKSRPGADADNVRATA